MLLSKPVYQDLKIDPTGSRHLFVFDRSAAQWRSRSDICTHSSFYVMPDSRIMPEQAPDAETNSLCLPFRSETQLLSYLESYLGTETMGLRLYAAGQESFVWDCYRVAQQAGMTRPEIHLAVSGEVSRRVYCVHCQTINHGAKSTLIQCDGCNATLFVRDHFSREHGAYMGFQVDAENPGEIPSAEALSL
ncbi:dimethylamine monooxygenase subunit DmmA family protein [Granulibacter bethesdensis]|uniref:Uncharacterized protein n=2 Tax=Granulibacter bethesdensis TaxID=364410 RepID=Q0BR27_GRABC|nr:dimethylamine monooxygenase subunit DmmA family protein [Granulibacter bethesdensis]ABI62725.1 Hypothetical protein GbCGDNIH1_1827 [Granulibacter bethesdensis CGDNIH1]AHJ63701.1 Hypothetical protein GbCGDNIH3_1827 [Granulibacter bethesdensis]AHJ68333.1 Hypothetical protein GbCGDNIH2_1827 [Granulibacter bethesdensis]APH52584.1 Hypothetical protein GbCGDNIH5_1827 [Granulibacter bethesdensis]APH60156.1 Hypothetical protein GbCGDNIH7_1827 [Granulibacter bethesdensis]